jgi:hypothetical protein
MPVLNIHENKLAKPSTTAAYLEATQNFEKKVSSSCVRNQTLSKHGQCSDEVTSHLSQAPASLSSRSS